MLQGAGQGPFALSQFWEFSASSGPSAVLFGCRIHLQCPSQSSIWLWHPQGRVTGEKHHFSLHFSFCHFSFGLALNYNQTILVSFCSFRLWTDTINLYSGPGTLYPLMTQGGPSTGPLDQLHYWQHKASNYLHTALYRFSYLATSCSLQPAESFLLV